MQPATESIPHFLAGFTVGEGCFSGTGGNRFVFEVGLGAEDEQICISFQEFLGVGHVFRSRRRKPHYDDEVTFAVQSIRELVAAVIPFMDEHLPRSYKRQQYLVWRARLLDYWAHRAKRVRPCTIEGCDKPRRAHGLCRRHLYVVHGI